MYSLGIFPPTILSTNSKPWSLFGSNLIQTWPYWPLPPDCLMCFPSISADFVIVSRYATCGAPTVASTPNSLFKRSTIISRCNSPIPEIIVCPVSSSVYVLNVGSSAANFCNPNESFSVAAFEAGSRAWEITGSGNCIFSRTNFGDFSPTNVSPVVVTFNPTAAAISPVLTSSISSLWLACISKIRPILSFSPLVEL